MIDDLLRVLTSDCSSDGRCFPTPLLPMTKVPVARAQTSSSKHRHLAFPSPRVKCQRRPPPGSRRATQMAFCSCSSQSNARIQRGSHLVNVVAHLAQMPKRFLASTLCSHIKHVAALSLPIMPTTLWPFLLKIEPNRTLELIGCFFPQSN